MAISHLRSHFIQSCIQNHRNVNWKSFRIFLLSKIMNGKYASRIYVHDRVYNVSSVYGKTKIYLLVLTSKLASWILFEAVLSMLHYMMFFDICRIYCGSEIQVMHIIKVCLSATLELYYLHFSFSRQSILNYFYTFLWLTN